MKVHKMLIKKAVLIYGLWIILKVSGNLGVSWILKIHKYITFSLECWISAFDEIHKKIAHPDFFILNFKFYDLNLLWLSYMLTRIQENRAKFLIFNLLLIDVLKCTIFIRGWFFLIHNCIGHLCFNNILQCKVLVKK